MAATLILAGQTASASPLSLRADGSTAQPRVVDLGHHDRVLLTPVGTAGPTTVSPLSAPDGATPGIFLTRTGEGTSIQSADGGPPTIIAGRAQPATRKAGAADLVKLHFSAIARDGRDAVAHINVMDLATGTVSTRELPADPATGSQCTTASFAFSSCILVPPGDYSVMAFVTTMPAAEPSTVASRTVENVALVGKPEAHVTASRDFTFDAREARPITVATPGRPAKVNAEGALQIGYRRTASNGRSFDAMLTPAFMLDNHFYLQPTAAVSIGAFRTLSRLRLEAPDIQLSAPGAGRCTRSTTTRSGSPMWPRTSPCTTVTPSCRSWTSATRPLMTLRDGTCVARSRWRSGPTRRQSRLSPTQPPAPEPRWW